jgi:hypothetical protein
MHITKHRIQRPIANRISRIHRALDRCQQGLTRLPYVDEFDLHARQHDVTTDRVAEVKYGVQESMFGAGQFTVGMGLAQQRADLLLAVRLMA